MWDFFKKIPQGDKLQNAIAMLMTLLETDTNRLHQICRDLEKTSSKLMNIERNFREVSERLESSVDSSIDELLLEENANPISRKQSDSQLENDLKRTDKEFHKIRSLLRKTSIPTIEVESKQMKQQGDKICKQILKLGQDQIILTSMGYFAITSETDKFQVQLQLQHLNILLEKHNKALQQARQYPSGNTLNKRKDTLLMYFNNSRDYLMGSAKLSAKVAPVVLDKKTEEDKPKKLFRKR